MPGVEFWLPLGLIVGLLASVVAAGVASLFRRPALGQALPSLSEVADELTLLHSTGRTRQGARVGEPEFRAMLLFWPGPCIDTNYYGLSTLRRLWANPQPEMLRGLIAEKRDGLIQMIRDHYDEDGGFKHHRRSWRSLCASVLGAHQCRWCVEPESFVSRNDDRYASHVEALTDCLGRDAVGKLRGFARRCEREEGGFGQFPGALAGAITTDAGYRLLRMLGEQPKYPEATADFIWRSYRPDPNGGSTNQPFGFANRPSDDQPTCSATRFAVRTLEDHPQLTELRGLTDEQRLAIIDFLRGLQDREDRGFRFSKGDVSCVVQTWLAFAALKSLAKKAGLKLEEVVPYGKIAPYLQLLKGPDYRFGYRPFSPPNIYATRALAHLVGLMEEVYASISPLGGIKPRILDAVYQHLDELTGLFVGYAHDGRPLGSRTPSIAPR